MKQKIASIKNHIKKHRAKYASLGTAFAFLMLIRRNSKQIDEFLIERNIDPAEYWLPE